MKRQLACHDGPHGVPNDNDALGVEVKGRNEGTSCAANHLGVAVLASILGQGAP